MVEQQVLPSLQHNKHYDSKYYTATRLLTIWPFIREKSVKMQPRLYSYTREKIQIGPLIQEK